MQKINSVHQNLGTLSMVDDVAPFDAEDTPQDDSYEDVSQNGEIIPVWKQKQR